MNKFYPSKFKEFGPYAQAAEQYKQKKKKKKLIIIFIILFVLTIIFWGWALSLNQQRESNNLQIIDSLKSELFIEQTNVQRYQIVIDRIKDEDSVLYEKVEKYLSETE